MIRTLALAAVAALSLSGCALLSSPDPVQLYRFGDAGGTLTTSAASPVQVKLRSLELPQAASGDRLLGVTGAEAAYIAERLVNTPAVVRKSYVHAIVVDAYASGRLSRAYRKARGRGGCSRIERALGLLAA